MNHTPGPWRRSPEERWGAVIAEAPPEMADDGNVKAYGGLLIAESIYRPGDKDLIAAAPELLEALQGFETFHSGHINCPEVGLLLKNARAAIAKATGAT